MESSSNRSEQQIVNLPVEGSTPSSSELDPQLFLNDTKFKALEAAVLERNRIPSAPSIVTWDEEGNEVELASLDSVAGEALRLSAVVETEEGGSNPSPGQFSARAMIGATPTKVVKWLRTLPKHVRTKISLLTAEGEIRFTPMQKFHLSEKAISAINNELGLIQCRIKNRAQTKQLKKRKTRQQRQSRRQHRKYSR